MSTNHYKTINQVENMTTINTNKMPILMLQDEPIRETRENLIPFRRMIKGRKSSKLEKILDLTNFGFQHWHYYFLFVVAQTRIVGANRNYEFNDDAFKNPNRITVTFGSGDATTVVIFVMTMIGG